MNSEQTMTTQEGVTISYVDDKIWDNYEQYKAVEKVKTMTVPQMLQEFHTSFQSKRNVKWGDDPALEDLATALITEEYTEFAAETSNLQNILGELADLVYVAYGYADRWGWDLNEAVRRKHIANMSKLGEDGKPVFREDGKIMKGPNFKPADLSDLV